MQMEPDAQPPSEDFVAEVLRLRRDNASLLDLNAALKEGNAALKDANVALKELVNSLQQERTTLLSQRAEHQPCGDSRPAAAVQYPEQTPSIVKLPQKLLLRIFLETMPTTDSYDPSAQAGPRAPWVVSVATRKALTLVCRHWYRPASEALYCDIVFRRMGQVAALARTLRTARVKYGPDPSKYIKRICMARCVALGRFLETFQQELAIILEYCSNLVAFECYHHPEFPVITYPPFIRAEEFINAAILEPAGNGTPGSALVKRCASSIQKLAFSETLQLENLLCIHACLLNGRLNTLVLGPVCSGYDLTDDTSSLDAPYLPHLQRLDIHADNENFLDWISGSWEMPGLTHLTLSSCQELPHALLVSVGANLEYLHIVSGPEWEGEKAGDVLRDLSVLCPHLEHLILPTTPALNLPCIINSTSLLYLDIWGPIQNRRVLELMCEMGHVCSLPKLRAIRMLPTNIRSDAHTLLPLHCDPSQVRGDETRFLTVLGVPLLQTSWAVLLDMHVSSGDDSAEAGTESDTEYVEPTTEEESDEDMASEPDVEVEGSSTARSSNAGADDNVDEGDEDDAEDAEMEEDDGASSTEEDGDEEMEDGCDREALLEMFAQGQVGGYIFEDSNKRCNV
ncbi:hypothetical protein C8Q73DRAFT_149348 [Cubamyces lactineus]|nr:hypothetical protein C8Q73DRAFT_149348 [Cubamyces lactineus]